MNKIILIAAFAIFLVGCGDEGRNQAVSSDTKVSEDIDISMRESMLDSSTGVLVLKNISQKVVNMISLDYRNQDTNLQMSYHVGPLASGQTIEIGILESNWPIRPNEVITINASNHKSVDIYVWSDGKGNIRYSEGYLKKKVNQMVRKLRELLK